MSSIIIASFPAHGHVTPLLAVAENFVKRGDDVRFITGSLFADRVAATGASYVPLPTEADFDDLALDERFPERARLKGARAIAFDIEHVFARPAKAQYDTVIAALAAQPADVVFAEPVFVGAAFLLGHQRPTRPPVVMCGVFRSRSKAATPHRLALDCRRRAFLNRPRNAALAAVNRRVLRQADQTIDALHSEVHGNAMPGTLVDWGRRADAIVQFSVPSFEYPRSDAPATLHFADRCPPPAHRLRSRTGGLISMEPGPSSTSLRAPLPTPTTGKSLRLRFAALPMTMCWSWSQPAIAHWTRCPRCHANTRAATYLPYDELLPRTDVYVTNGGYGGVQYALSYGVPIVATGGKEDKPEVGARVAWSGVGRRIRSEHPTPRALRRDILAVLNQPRYRLASRRVAADMAAAPGFAGLADIVDQLVGCPALPDRPPTTPVRPGRLINSRLCAGPSL